MKEGSSILLDFVVSLELPDFYRPVNVRTIVSTTLPELVCLRRGERVSFERLDFGRGCAAERAPRFIPVFDFPSTDALCDDAVALCTAPRPLSRSG